MGPNKYRLHEALPDVTPPAPAPYNPAANAVSPPAEAKAANKCDPLDKCDPPVVLQRVEPRYSEEARKARYDGTVVLEVIIRADGSVDVQRIVRSLGFGLDENAIAAIKQWKFRPGMRNGVPVDLSLNVEVNFHLGRRPGAK
ncbi:MAG: hypothetical protein DMG97_29960 [Acidobacteria bacterium]|nr:MAG: hypothetical protein DMG97_29960 [Acidobacteriota bacterium]